MFRIIVKDSYFRFKVKAQNIKIDRRLFSCHLAHSRGENQFFSNSDFPLVSVCLQKISCEAKVYNNLIKAFIDINIV